MIIRQKNWHRNTSGFTLIELLVVIAIIGVISGLVLASISTARVKARDTQRLSDMRQIKTALEMFFDDKGFYPQSNCGWECNNYRYSWDSSWDSLAADLAPYISPLPKDPINSTCPPWTSNCFSYTYGNVSRTKPQYDLTMQFENDSNPQRCGVKGWRFYFDNRRWCTAFGGSYVNEVYEISE